MNDGARRQHAQSLRQDVETVWDRLRAEFSLQDQFWLGFLFGAEAPDVAELVARSRDLALSEVKWVDVLRLNHPEDVSQVLGRLLAEHPDDLAMTWVGDTVGSTLDRTQVWTHLPRTHAVWSSSVPRAH